MKFFNCVGSLPAIGLIAALMTAPADAQTRVGEAAVVKNEVLRVAGPSTSQIKVGDGLLRDETVRTGIDSATRLVMADSTNLSLGPNAMLKLDRTVFDDEHHYRDVALRMTSGAFRFVTGHPAPRRLQHLDRRRCRGQTRHRWPRPVRAPRRSTISLASASTRWSPTAC